MEGIFVLVVNPTHDLTIVRMQLIVEQKTRKMHGGEGGGGLTKEGVKHLPDIHPSQRKEEKV